jgi:adenosylmethionine-8-amino-7-oxononanoate aminotransferase
MSHQTGKSTLPADRIWHPYTRFSAFRDGPLPVIERGDGVYLVDDQGRRYFDAISTWWACSLGHGHPRVVAAIHAQTDLLQHSILGNLSHPGALSLAGRLSDLTGGDRRVHFAGDGASAIEAALKIAIQYADNLGHAGRHAFLSLTDPYHGDTLGAVSVGYLELFHRAFKPVLFKTYTTPAPVCTACGCSTDPDACPAPCFTGTEQSLLRHRDELAAVIVEPLCQGAAGMRMYGAAYLRRLALPRVEGPVDRR